MPAIDHSAVLLDAVAMGERLRRCLPDPRPVSACRIHQSRRRISRQTEEQGAPYLGVVYEIALDGAAATPRWCYVKAYSRGASRTASAAAAPLRLDDLDALAWWLPDDPALPQLADFLDPQRAQRELRRLLGTDDVDPPAVAIVRHEPESHCTARFAMNVRGRATTVFGKAYADDRWAAAARRIEALAAASVAPRAFAIARPLGASGELRAVWQQGLHGVPLRERLRGAPADAWLARVADALAVLQGGAVIGEDELAPGSLLARTAKQCRKLARADAALAGALEPALARLQADVPAGDVVSAHGDFHADQMLCSDERVALFDFDNFAAGSAALDVADFASQLLTDADFDRHRRGELAARFVELCLARLPRRPSASELDWHLRALLLRKAYSFFVRHRAGWRERVLEAAGLAAIGSESLR